MAGVTEPWSIGWFRAIPGNFLGLPSGTVTFGEELRGDTECDLVRMIGAEIEADGAMKLRGAFGGEAGRLELATEHCGFRGAADYPEEGEIALGQGALQDGTIGRVAFCHTQDKRVRGQRRHEIGG